LCLTSLQERNHPTPTRAIAFDFCQEDARGTLFFHQASTRLGAQRRKKGLATGCPLVLPGAQGTRVEPMAGVGHLPARTKRFVAAPKKLAIGLGCPRRRSASHALRSHR
jgi:hypothetical protein